LKKGIYFKYNKVYFFHQGWFTGVLRRKYSAMVLTYEFAHDCLKEYTKTSHRHMNNIKNSVF